MHIDKQWYCLTKVNRRSTSCWANNPRTSGSSTICSLQQLKDLGRMHIKVHNTRTGIWLFIMMEAKRKQLLSWHSRHKCHVLWWTMLINIAIPRIQCNSSSIGYYFASIQLVIMECYLSRWDREFVTQLPDISLSWGKSRLSDNNTIIMSPSRNWTHIQAHPQISSQVYELLSEIYLWLQQFLIKLQK